MRGLKSDSFWIALGALAALSGCQKDDATVEPKRDITSVGPKRHRTSDLPKTKTIVRIGSPDGMTKFDGHDATGGLISSWQAEKWNSPRFRPNVTYSKHPAERKSPRGRANGERWARNMADFLVKSYRRQLQAEGKVIASGVESIGSVDFLKCEVQYAVKGVSLRQIQVHVFSGSDHYMMIMTASLSEWMTWQPRFVSFYRSFQIRAIED